MIEFIIHTWNTWNGGSIVRLCTHGIEDESCYYAWIYIYIYILFICMISFVICYCLINIDSKFEYIEIRRFLTFWETYDS